MAAITQLVSRSHTPFATLRSEGGVATRDYHPVVCRSYFLPTKSENELVEGRGKLISSFELCIAC